MPSLNTQLFIVATLCLTGFSGLAQPPLTDAPVATPDEPALWSLEPASTFHKKRFWISASTGTAIYGGISVALWQAWYQDYPLSGFHTFNDMNEWIGMDKAGHFFASHMECRYVFQGARWTGMDRRKAMWTAAGIGTGIQATFEIMDGFSDQWGFSWGDIAFNTAGVGLFVAQEMIWQEQRIITKASGVRPAYDQSPIPSIDGGQQTTLDARAAELYGTSPFQVILKDYNALTVWSSANIHAFLNNRAPDRFPKWLNLAVGYGGGNVYGGFSNAWTSEDGAEFALDAVAYPRYRQFYLAPDIDLTRIPTRHRWLKFTLGILNWLKIPAPAFEFNTLGNAKFHILHW